ncbi:MAG: LysE family transporter [Candidatus Bathyarchaeia archaeon]
MFLTSVAVISLTGVMMPGPVTAVTVMEGRRDGNAGAAVAVGHALVELPLIFLIYFGLAHFFTVNYVRACVGLAGGGFLIYTGFTMIRGIKEDLSYGKASSGALLGGLLATALNPYFFVWWATVGSTLIMNSILFGLIGLGLFISTHWSCDLAWYLLLSKIMFKSKRYLKPLTMKAINVGLALLLAGFGLMFMITGLRALWPF